MEQWYLEIYGGTIVLVMSLLGLWATRKPHHNRETAERRLNAEREAHSRSAE
jgi:hypothetical protein